MALLNAAASTPRIFTVWDQFSGHFYELIDHLFRSGGDILWALLSVFVIYLGARLLLRSISNWTRRIMEKKQLHANNEQGKRVDTLMTLLRSASRYFIYAVAILLSLKQLGMGETIGNLLGAAAIGSVALGLGAQSFVKDVVGGVFLMFENQFAVGDHVKIGEYEGKIEATALRVTYLRTFRGEQVMLPNGTISTVVNYTRGQSNTAIITIPTPYDADTARVMDLIREAIADYAQQHPELIEIPPYVRGIMSFENNAVNIGVACKAKPLQHWDVERGLRLAIKEKLDGAGVYLAYSRELVQQPPLPEEYQARGPENQPEQPS